jgi:hypothetical protein
MTLGISSRLKKHFGFERTYPAEAVIGRCAR